jgi:hypothetical protein
VRKVPAYLERVERLAKSMLVTLRRKQGLSGGWLYQVLPDAHPACLLEPPWRPANEFCLAIRGAIAAAFLLFKPYKNEIQFTQEEWNGYFEAAEELSTSDPKDYPGWGSY